MLLVSSEQSTAESAQITDVRPRLVVTIDTEEDNWGDPKSSLYQLENIYCLPDVQKIFDSFRVRPTYLVTYPVAVHQDSVKILQDFVRSGKCEIGAHCHPWNTPPLSDSGAEERNGATMLCTLPPDAQLGKIKTLTDQIAASFGQAPVSFRAGRWGYGPTVGAHLAQLGYLVDTSVSPYIDWSSKCGPDFTQTPLTAYSENLNQLFPGTKSVPLLEIPASIGYLQQNFSSANKVYNFIAQSPLQKLHLIGLLHKLKLLNRIWLSPETQTEQEMINFARILINKRFSFLNFTFHSPSLKIGLTPFVRNESDRLRFLERIKGFLSFISDQGIETVTLRDAHAIVQQHSRTAAVVNGNG